MMARYVMNFLDPWFCVLDEAAQVKIINEVKLI